MPDFNETEIQLQHGYFFSPKFFLDYWEHSILSNFSSEEIVNGNLLREHREAWIGAHLAALKTALSGDHYFVGVPERDPPDVLIGNHIPVTVNGRQGMNFKWYEVENTRCDISAGEDLLSQILKKNKPAYTNTIVTVYLQGAEHLPDMQAVTDALKNTNPFYPPEVIVLSQAQDGANEGVANDTFRFDQVYPECDSYAISRNDENAYFSDPNVVISLNRGFETELSNLGTIRLMPPTPS